MDDHKNARLTVHSREQLARKDLYEGGAKTAAKWVGRYQQPGLTGLLDRSTRPQRLHRPTPPEGISRVEVLRRQRWTGFRIAQAAGLSRTTVSRILRRLGVSRVRDLDPRPVVQRYEHAAPGDLLHPDIKKLARIARPSQRVTGDRRDTVSGIGWEYVHVAIARSFAPGCTFTTGTGPMLVWAWLPPSADPL